MKFQNNSVPRGTIIVEKLKLIIKGVTCADLLFMVMIFVVGFLGMAYMIWTIFYLNFTVFKMYCYTERSQRASK